MNFSHICWQKTHRESINRNVRSGPQSRENVISVARLVVVFRRIPCVVRIVLHEWYSIISHRTLQVSHGNHVFHFNFWFYPLAVYANFPSIFRIFVLFYSSINYFKKTRKDLLWNIYYKLIHGFSIFVICMILPQILHWIWRYKFL